ncbi:MAG: membrane dipeptidase [Polyangiaceae bacterium]|nr:membrane dipeptidase [Polyangiaceae bacterium]
MTATLGPFRDPAQSRALLARELGISQHAVDLYFSSDVLDLHLDSFIWTRVFGYDLRKRHGLGLFGGAFYSQVDFPRALEAGLTGGTWVITTNPLRTARGRARTFVANLARLRSIIASVPEHLTFVRNTREYRSARAAGKHAAFIGIQGGNALDATPDSLDLIPDDAVLRVTVVHLSSSTLGATSSPLRLRGDPGLTTRGRDYVRALNARKIFVDLAHISPRGFWDAVEVHDKSQPLLVTHTGVSGVNPHWRNLDDEQLRAIADSGGTVGVMYQSSFLGDPVFAGRVESVIAHLAHIVETVGEDHASLGSDWDGAITPPRGLRTCTELPRVVDGLLRRGLSDQAVRKILGANFLRVVESLRG